jgi:endoglucanase
MARRAKAATEAYVKRRSTRHGDILRTLLGALSCLALTAETAGSAQQFHCMRGINLAGAEFGEVGQPFGKGYIYPSAETIAYFREKGFTSVRLPFLWERLQPKLYGRFDSAETKRLRATVRAIRAAGMDVILDPHNYGRYRKQVIGSEQVPQSAFSDFWRRLSALFAGQEGIVFGLMNEPYEIAAEEWLAAANGAIASIRQTGADNLILVPGTSWTGAHSWSGGDYGTPNAEVMAKVADPAGNFAYEFHQYLDIDFSGKHEECSRAADAVKAIASVGDWLSSQQKRGFLGEFAVSTLAECQSALRDVVATVEQRPEVWLGWSYWAAGDWWDASEPLNIQPTKDGDRPQMQTLQRFFSEQNSCSR